MHDVPGAPHMTAVLFMTKKRRAVAYVFTSFASLASFQAACTLSPALLSSSNSDPVMLTVSDDDDDQDSENGDHRPLESREQFTSTRDRSDESKGPVSH
jgi:hypothetical protein